MLIPSSSALSARSRRGGKSSGSRHPLSPFWPARRGARFLSSLRLQTLQHAPCTHRCFTKTLRRGDERHAEKPFATGSESRTGKDDQALLEAALSEYRARNVLGQGAPDVHRGLGPGNRKSGLGESVRGCVPAPLELRDVRRNPIGAFIESCCRGCLNCHECPGIDERLHLRQSSDELLLAARPPAAPSRHVVRLGHRVELDRDFTRALDFKNAWRHVPI